MPIVYETQGETRIIKIEKIVDGAITPVRGKDQGNVVIRNSEYWISPDIIVSRADKSRFRLLGRNWNFEGKLGGNLQARLGQSEEIGGFKLLATSQGAGLS